MKTRLPDFRALSQCHILANSRRRLPDMWAQAVSLAVPEHLEDYSDLVTFIRFRYHDGKMVGTLA
jgi:hypothetical protein